MLSALAVALLGLPAGALAGPVEVMVWDFGGVPGHQAWIRQAVDNFNTAQQEIHVDLEIRDWATQRESLISTTIVGEGPDIIRVHHKYAVEFGQLGGLYALENFPDFPEVAARFFPNVLEQVEYQGRHYGLPITMLPFVLAVNQSLLARHHLSVPRTWEEMKAMGPALKEHGIDAFTMPGGVNLDTAYRFLPLLYKAGGRVFDEGWTRATFNGPAGLAALSFLLEMKQAGYFPSASAAYAFDENAAHWCTEQAALSIEGPWWQDIVLGNYKFDLAKLALAQVPGPARPLEPNPPRTLLDVVMVSITGYTRVPQQAWIVLKALNVDDPVWKVPNPAMGGIPAHRAAYEPGVESRYIGLEVLAEAGRNGLGWPGHPGITEIQRAIADAVNMALTGALGPQQALDAAAEEVDEILNDY
jgi:multiple sugar transport system substrate-binding protein